MGLLDFFKKKRKIEVKGNRVSGDVMFADISHYRPINFNLYDKKILITKATEGTSNIDSTFAKVKAGAKAKGIIFGAYHFFRCNKPAIQQAEHFLSVAGYDCDFYILDLETTDGASSEGIRQLAMAFLKHIEAKTGKLPILYSYNSFLTGLNMPVEFTKYPLWLARYSNTLPTAPAPWKDWLWWQYSDNDFYNGIGNCDGNVYNKDNSHGIKMG